MNRDVHLDFHVRHDALKVHVHDQLFGGMALDIFDDRRLRFIADFDVQNA